LTYNPAVTDADKESMGLPLHDNTSTSTPSPPTIPEAEIDSSIIRQLTIHFKDDGSEKRGKPAEVHGMEIVWDMIDTAPVRWTNSKIPPLTRQALIRLPLTKRSGTRRCIFVPDGKITKGTNALE
jgi:hypothetical protein